MNLSSKVGQKPVVVRKTKKLGERQRKALFTSEGSGHDNDDDDDDDDEFAVVFQRSGSSSTVSKSN